jgi:TFIIF-interacting CTD phosphatase-like protein
VGPIIDKLDPNHLAARVYQSLLVDKNGAYVKDITRLKRPIENVITIDPFPDQYYNLQRENILPVKPWNGDKRDNFLLESLVFLECKSYRLIYYQLIY